MKKRYHFKGVLMRLSFVVLLTACGNSENIVGTWVQPVPGLPKLKQGFVLEEGGKASSIDMATLRYETWQQEGSLLILSGKSIGNHQIISFSDTLSIEKQTRDSLVLKKGQLVFRYAREDAKSLGKTVESIPAAVITPAKKTQTVKGRLSIGPEVRSFIPEGSDDAYWVIDETGELYQKYDKVTGGVKNGVPVYAELQVEDTGKSNEGFSAGYKSVYKVYKIHVIQEVAGK